MGSIIIEIPINGGNGKGRNFKVTDESARRLKHILSELERLDTTPWEQVVKEITAAYDVNETVFTGTYYELGCLLANGMDKEKSDVIIRTKEYWQWWQAQVSYMHLVAADTLNEAPTNNKVNYLWDIVCSMMLDDDLHQNYYENFVSYKESGSYIKQIHNHIKTIFSDETAVSKSKGKPRQQ